jgi:hypothetical protein
VYTFLILLVHSQLFQSRNQHPQAIGVLSGIAKKEELVDADYVIETAVSVPEVLKKYTQF